MSALKMKPNICKWCSWEESELRRRIIANGSTQIVYQCLNCGRSAGNPLPHTSVKEPHKLPPWHDGLAEEYDRRRADDRPGKRQEWFDEHNTYLRSPEWRKRRALVMERAGSICEGCRSAVAVHVHHLTYEHWRNELLWELVAVCEPCHERAHGRSLGPGL